MRTFFLSFLFFLLHLYRTQPKTSNSRTKSNTNATTTPIRELEEEGSGPLSEKDDVQEIFIFLRFDKNQQIVHH